MLFLRCIDQGGCIRGLKLKPWGSLFRISEQAIGGIYFAEMEGVKTFQLFCGLCTMEVHNASITMGGLKLNVTNVSTATPCMVG